MCLPEFKTRLNSEIMPYLKRANNRMRYMTQLVAHVPNMHKAGFSSQLHIEPDVVVTGL